MSGRGESARSEYVQARLDAILSGAGPVSDRAPVEGATVLSARRRLPIPVLAEAMGPPRRSRPGARGHPRQTAAPGAGAGVTTVAPGRPAPVDAPVRPHPPGPWPGADDPTVPLEAVPVDPVLIGSPTDASRSGSTRFDPAPPDHAADDPDWFERLLAEPAGSGSTGSRPTARAERSGSQPRPGGSRTGGARPPGDPSGHSSHPVDGRSELEDERAVRITIPRLTRRHLVVLATVLALAVAFSAFLLLRARADPLPVLTATPVAPEGQQGDPVPSAPAPTPTPVPVLVVHVLGAVAEPGVVELPEGSRVADALEAAGGLEKGADPGALNLAQVLQDGQQVHVSEQAEDSEVRGPGGGSGAGGDGSGGDGSGTGGAGQLLDLNSATAEQLEELPGVGPVTAEKILAWREEHGRFSRVEELQEVSGIGPKSFAEIAPHVRV